MKWLIILLLFCSCASTEKLLRTKDKNEVVKIETRKASLKNSDKTIFTLAIFLGYCLMANKE